MRSIPCLVGVGFVLWWYQRCPARSWAAEIDYVSVRIYLGVFGRSGSAAGVYGRSASARSTGELEASQSGNGHKDDGTASPEGQGSDNQIGLLQKGKSRMTPIVQAKVLVDR